MSVFVVVVAASAAAAAAAAVVVCRRRRHRRRLRCWRRRRRRRPLPLMCPPTPHPPRRYKCGTVTDLPGWDVQAVGDYQMPCDVMDTQLIAAAAAAAAAADVTLLVIGDQTTVSTDPDYKGQCVVDGGGQAQRWGGVVVRVRLCICVCVCLRLRVV